MACGLDHSGKVRYGGGKEEKHAADRHSASAQTGFRPTEEKATSLSASISRANYMLIALLEDWASC
jgi:hypothetical protein